MWLQRFELEKVATLDICEFVLAYFDPSHKVIDFVELQYVYPFLTHRYYKCYPGNADIQTEVSGAGYLTRAMLKHIPFDPWWGQQPQSNA